MRTFRQFITEAPRTPIARWMVKCPYCQKVFAIDGGVTPWQRTYPEVLEIVEKHATVCPKTEIRLRFRIKPHYQDRNDVPEYSDPVRRGRAAFDVMTADWKMQQVSGTYNADIKCGSKCRNSKGPQCDCSCGGANHGSGFSI